jgi:prephenate dehydrogenase
MVGAIPYFIDPHEHDGLIGGTEHLADTVAAALLGTLAKSDDWPDIRHMGGSTFGRVAHFSEPDPAEYRGRAVLNRANVLRWIDAFQRELSEFRQLVEQEDGDAIEHYFGTHMDVRLQWLEDRANQDWGDRPQESEIPSSGEFMSQMFFGGFGRRRREG